MKRLLGLIAIIIVTAVTGVLSFQIGFDNSIEVYFLERDPDLVSYKKFTEAFETDQIIIFAWRDEQLWTAEGLRFVHDLGEAGLELEHVRKARSLTSISEVVAEPGVLSVRPMYDPDDPPDPAELKEKVLGNDMLRGTLVGEDGDVVAVILTVDHLMGETHLKRDLASSVRELADEFGARRGVDIKLGGPTLTDDAFLRRTQRDFGLILPLMVAVIVLVILALFQTPRALVLPMAVVAIDCVWVTGVSVLFGSKLTIIHGIIYPMLLGIGVATAVHLLSRTLLLRREGAEPKDAAYSALRQLLVPAFFTAATTVAGLSSLNFSTLAPLRQFGQLGAFGVFSAFVLSYALGPWLLPWLAAKEPVGTEAGHRLDPLWRKWDAGLTLLGEFALRRARGILLVAFGLMILGVAGLLFVEVGSNPVEYFHKRDVVRTDLEFIDSELAGTTMLEILIDTGEYDGVKEPEVLAKMARIGEWLDGIEGVGAVVSLADYVMELRKAMRGGADEDRRIPDSRAEVAQLLLMLDDPEEVEAFVDFDFQQARVSATVRLSQTQLLTDRMPELEALLEQEFQAPATGQATGMSKLIANMDAYLLRSALWSMGLAFVTVLLFMTLALRSVRLGLFSMIPNILPVAMVIGFMGWVGIRLDPGTTMIGAVALGLVVDNTVHFLHHLRKRIVAGDDMHDAVVDTLMKTGRAVVTTSTVLALGFWLMLLASFMPNINFGLLCGLAIAIALVADLVVLPAALVVVRPDLSAAKRARAQRAVEG
jgi:uncharacterized protein